MNRRRWIVALSHLLLAVLTVLALTSAPALAAEDDPPFQIEPVGPQPALASELRDRVDQVLAVSEQPDSCSWSLGDKIGILFLHRRERSGEQEWDIHSINVQFPAVRLEIAFATLPEPYDQYVFYGAQSDLDLTAHSCGAATQNQLNELVALVDRFLLLTATPNEDAELAKEALGNDLAAWALSLGCNPDSHLLWQRLNQAQAHPEPLGKDFPSVEPPITHDTLGLP